MRELTEFLLARIAEDEAVARAWARAYNNPGSHPDYHYATMRRHRREWPVLWHSLDAYPPARVLAECESKRRIVTNAEHYIPGERGYGASHYAMQCVALPYADHADYRKEWRP